MASKPDQLPLTINCNSLFKQSFIYEPGHLFGAPPTGDAGGTWRPVIQDVTAVALVHYLPVIGHFANVRSVIIEAHVTDQKDLPVLDVARERAINYHHKL